MEINDTKINDLLDSASFALVHDSPEKCADALLELAHICSTGGNDGRQMFECLRRIVITGAVGILDIDTLIDKLKHVERQLQIEREKNRH